VQTHRLGSKIRELRRKNGLTQAALAQRLAVSPSYLNLIENERRPLPASLLLRLVELFRVDLAAFRGDEEAKLELSLIEALADPVFELDEVDTQQVRRLAAQTPELARGMLALYRAFRAAREMSDADRFRGDEPHPALAADPARSSAEVVSDFLQTRVNHFPALEEAAERLVAEARLGSDELFPALARFLEKRHRVKVRIEKVQAMRGALRRYDDETRELRLSEVLRRGSRHFQLAHQVALLHHASLLDTLIDDPLLAGVEARRLARVSLANYFAAAVLMPYAEVIAAAREVRYDVELLGHRFRASFEQVCHRLTTLRRKGAEGVPFDFVRVDIAGNISKRFAATGVRFPRFSGLCPLWNVHAAFLRPGFVRTQISKFDDGRASFSIARTIEKHRGGFHSPTALYAIALGTDLESARELVYADGVDLGNANAAVPVGITCRLCARRDCEARAFPPLREPLRIDENVLGTNFWAPLEP
jgi:predicted transcriptional regulator/DNA-binding XRE family transcriptional regulator